MCTFPWTPQGNVSRDLKEIRECCLAFREFQIGTPYVLSFTSA